MPPDSLLSAGAAAVDITPGDPQWLDGYGNRTAPSEGVYLPIHARALCLQQGGRKALVLSAEVLGFDRARVPGLKARIARAAGVEAGGVILLATHTHCAPRVCEMVMPGRVDPDYLGWFEERCVEAAEQAAAAPRPARIAFSRTVEQLGVNRRVWTGETTIMRPNPDGPRDRDLDTLWFEDAGSGAAPATGTIASLTVAACHPTSRGGPLIGGDYPGFALRELEQATGAVALFGLGCAGDVRPGFTNEEGRFRMAELEEVEAAGCRLAADVLASRSDGQALDCRRLEVRRRELEIATRVSPDEARLREVSQADPNALRREWAVGLLRDGRVGRAESLPFELQVLDLAPGARLLCLPGEVAADYALAAKQEYETNGRPLLVAAYANGAVGYVPSAAMIPFGGYEVDGSHPFYNLPAPYADEVETRLRAGIAALLDCNQ